MQNIEDNAAVTPETKPRKSKAALLSFLVSLLCFGLFPFIAWLAIGLGVFALVKIKRSNGMLKGKILAYFGIIIPSILIAFFFVVSFDAPPIENDWTIDDLRSVKAENIGSYDVLLGLADSENDPNGTAIGLSKKDTEILSKILHSFSNSDWQYAAIADSVKTNTNHIEQLWRKTQPGRAVIESLYEYDEMADLTKPDIDATIGYLGNLKRLTHLYNVYACLQVEQGNDKVAINELVKFDSMLRKLMINSRTVISRLVCQAGLSQNLKTASFIASHANISPESLNILANQFLPFDKEIVSLENILKHEYLILKNSIDVEFFEDMSKQDEEKLRNHWVLKRNSSLRLHRNYCETILSLASNSSNQRPPYQCVWPKFYPVRPHIEIPLDSSEDLYFIAPWYYYIYNPVGSLHCIILALPGNKIISTTTKFQIQDDLFQIVLAMRLGQGYDLTARAYGDEYIVDVEKKIIFSVGLDGEAYTEDDISLPINPEVLGLVDGDK